MTGGLSFTVPGNARGKGRPKATARAGFVRMYTDKATATYENMVALKAQEALSGRPPLDEPLALGLVVRVCPPASTPKKKRAAMLAGEMAHTRKPDLDNVIKAVLDGCNGIAFRDDVLVDQITARKRWSEVAGVDVVLTPLFAGAAA